MTRIAKLSRISPEVRKTLLANKVKTTDRLWLRIGQASGTAEQPVDVFDASVQTVAEDFKLKAADMRAVLIEGEQVDAHSGEGLPLTLIPVVLLMVLLIAVLTARLLDSMALIGQVVAVDGLTAFQVIEEDDVALKAMPATTEGVREIPAVVGHYLLSPVEKDQVILRNHLSGVAFDASSLQERVIISIPLSYSSLNPNGTPGTQVELVLSPRAPGPNGQLMDALRVDAIVLKLDNQKESVVGTFAISQSAIDAVARALGTSDIYIVQPAP